jgi:predicted RNA binding protein with dsRBD fold (UPF0201 family)
MERPRDLFDEDFLGETPQRTKVRTRHQKKMVRLSVEPRAARFAHVELAGDVRLEAPVLGTEDPLRVEAAMRALFPDVVCQARGEGGPLRARAGGLTRLAEVMRHARIRDTAREFLRGSIGPDRVVRFRLNKQAACAARVNFVKAGTVLGELEVEIATPHPEFLVEELTWIEGESDERLFGTRLHTLPPKVRRGE